jgi:hypothetical protein
VVGHALVDVFAALVGGESLFVAGDVGVGEGVLVMPLVCALNGRICDEEVLTGSQTLPPAAVAPPQIRGQFWV